MKQTKIITIDPDAPEPEKITEAAHIISSGGLVAFPTETVYGLAAVMNDDLALERLRHIKKRAEEKKFSLCVHSVRQVEELCGSISPFAYRLIKKFWPGPLTLVLPSDNGGMIGVRMPDHPVALQLLKQVKIPVLAPSANFAGKKPPTCAEEVMADLGGLIDAVIDSGKTKWEIGSTVCRVEDGSFTLLRQGVIHIEMIQLLARQKHVLFVCTGNSCRSAMAEGLMKKKLDGNAFITVSSAGVAAFEGMPATEEAVNVMEQQGIDISEHHARRLTESMIKESDLILVMEQGHRRFIADRFPSAVKRVFLLREFIGEEMKNVDIEDPIGMSLDFYEQSSLILKKAVEGVAAKLQ